MLNKDFVWNSDSYKEFETYLDSFKESDKFLNFTKKLVFTKYEMIGVKVPNLRKLAKEISKTNIYDFFKYVSSNTYEEVMLEGLVISYIKDYDIFCEYLDKFILKIDNWAICDICVSSMKIVSKNKDKFFKKIKKYLKSKNEYTIRVGLIFLLDYYIDDGEGGGRKKNRAGLDGSALFCEWAVCVVPLWPAGVTSR